MTYRTKTKPRLTRHQFEQLVSGTWTSLSGGRYRSNGKFKTAVQPGWKLFHDGQHVIRARTWLELARGLKLI